jgi:acetolactate synthase-1/2/3 large subunit
MSSDQASSFELNTCAEEILYLLAVHGVNLLFLNPGTDSAPLQEAALALSLKKAPSPRLITTSFESVALAAAHGYWQATRRPQAVFVHVDVGTQNLGAMVHNIMRDRAGVVVLAGKTPYAEDSLSLGARSSFIHWQQDVPDQAGIVRGYAKWIMELTRADDAPRVIGRAIQMAAGDIPGLAYLMMSRDVLMQPPSMIALRRTTGYALPTPPAVAPDVLDIIKERLIVAKRPVIITNRVGRRPDGERALSRLVDLLAVPVVDKFGSVNLSTLHPMRVGSSSKSASLISEADLILIVESDVPWIPKETTLAPGVFVVNIDPDPIKVDMPLWSFPVDLAVTADGSVALTQIAGEIESLAPHSLSHVEDRRHQLAKQFNSTFGLRSGEESTDGRSVLEVKEVICALNDILEPSDLVVLEAVSNGSLVGELLERTEPDTLFTAGGPGLGWALGAAVGIKLARPEQRVIAVVGDGAFMFGVPTAALCLAAEAAAPFVTVILDNGGYRASKLPVYQLFPTGVSAAKGYVIGAQFVHPPNFVKVAQSCGAYSKLVDSPATVRPVLRRALAEVDRGRSAVIHMQIQQ